MRITALSLLLRRRLPKVIAALIAITLCIARAQGPAVKGLSLTTRDRMGDAGWWPTKGGAPRSQYAGSETCKGCHNRIAIPQETTPMNHAGVRAAESEVLKSPGQLKFHEPGFNYSLNRTPEAVIFSARDGASDSDAPAVWAFGAGEYGQTYILEKNGAYTEGRLSYFTRLHAFDITPGQASKTPHGVDEALGKKLDTETARLCFGCHTTGAVTSKKLDSEKATPGVTCEACHGTGASHVAAMREKDDEDGPATILNPRRLSPSDSVD